MKESAQRILAWVKQHPYISAAILLVVVVLGYLAYKRGAFSGSKSESNVSAEDNSGLPPESGIGTSPIPDSSVFTSPSTSSGGVTTSGGDTGSSNYGTPSGGYDTGSMIPLPIPDFLPTPSLSDLSVLNSGAASQLGAASGGVATTKQKSASPLGSASGGTVTQQAASLGAASGGVATTKKKSASPLGKASGGAASSVPSTQYGKGPHFTGYIKINGVNTYFVNGYPSYSAAATQNSAAINAGNKPAVVNTSGLKY